MRRRPGRRAPRRLKAFHRTAHGETILRDGFTDSSGTYGMLTGVWLADRPLDSNEGTNGDDLLVVDVPTDVFERFELIEEDNTYREACIPAAVINQYPRRWATPEEHERTWPTT
jgi:hypothetical protein